MHTAIVRFPINLPRKRARGVTFIFQSIIGFTVVPLWFIKWHINLFATWVYIFDVLEEPHICRLVYSNFVKRLNSLL